MDAPLEPGTIISHYRILSRLGAGGMGEVYLAQDTTLERKVAIKFLAREAADERQARKRLIREAQAAAQLDHPNICATYEVGETDGAGFIVMQYIEGETLAARVRRSPLPLSEAVDTALQVADALAEAHARGILHRDVKPQNIMISARGQAKVLDFGLAKIVPGLPASHVATESAITAPGAIVGTLPYMSPEQLKGEPVDERSDIFSFGATLYELVSGRQPFAADTVAATTSSILTTDPPPLARFAREVPAELERITAKALAKQKDERYQSARDLFVDLRTLRRDLDRRAPAAVPGAAPVAGRQQSLQPILMVAAVLVVALLGWYVFSGRRSSPSAFHNMTIARLTHSGNAVQAAISPDGKYVAYVMSDAGRQSVWLRQAATTSHVQIVAPADGHVYRGLSFSRDGNYLYFLDIERGRPRGTLRQIPILGGDARTVITDVSIQDTDSNYSFSPDGSEVALIRLDARFNRTLVIAKADGSAERTLAARTLPVHLAGTAWSPDGKTIASLEGNYGGGTSASAKKFLTIGVTDGVERVVSPRLWARVGSFAWLSGSDGLIVSAVDKLGPAQLWQLTIATGEARRVTNDLNNYQTVSLTADSKALVASQTDTALHIWIAPDGDATRATRITSEAGDYQELGWTRDGRIIYQSAASNEQDIWSISADGRSRRQLTSNAGTNTFPSTPRDGDYIVFASDRERNGFRAWRMKSDGSDPRRITNISTGVPTITPDGLSVLYFTFGETSVSLLRIPIDGGEPVALTEGGTVSRSVMSPDGKYLASNYMATAPRSQFRVALVRVGDKTPERVFDIPTFPVRELRWMPDSKAIAFIDSRDGVSNVWAQPIDGSPAFQVTKFTSGTIASFNWSHDGRQLACARGPFTSDVVLISDFK